MSLQEEINQLTMEVGILRKANDNLADVQKSINKEKLELINVERQLREAFERQLEELKAKKAEKQNMIWNVDDKINANKSDIEAKLKLLAEKAALMQEQSFMDELEATIQGYISQIKMWEQAADFQKQDILEIFKAYKLGKNGFANFNDMGLGKTLIAIMALALIRMDFMIEHGREPRICWSTKKSLILATMREFHMWLPGHPAMPFNYDISTAQERTILFSLAMQTGSTIIMNYEAINTTPEILATQFDIVVIDEVHKLKGGANATPTKIWQNYKKLLRDTRFMIFLSGTPMVNHPKEMWAYLHLFNPEKFPKMRQFESMFGVLDKGTSQIVISADALLKGALMGQCVRRRRDEVGIQLPELIHSYRFLQMGNEQRKHYDMANDNFFVWLGEQDDKKLLPFSDIIAQLTRLRMINILPSAVSKEIEGEKFHIECDESSKIDEAMDIIRELHEQGEQVLVFSTFNEPLREVIRRCNKHNEEKDEDTGEADRPITTGLITGSSREHDLDQQFQNKELDVLCINLFMGEGLNLQKNPERWIGGASHAIFLDLWWTPAKNEQAEARIHRRGANQSCQIHILYNEESIDAFIAKKLEDKSQTFANILERDEIRPASEWKKLFSELNTKKGK